MAHKIVLSPESSTVLRDEGRFENGKTIVRTYPSIHGLQPGVNALSTFDHPAEVTFIAWAMVVRRSAAAQRLLILGTMAIPTTHPALSLFS